MNRIDALLQNATNPVLSIYYTAGYPDLNDTRPILNHLVESGVDLVEIGIPYSDPMADGPTIQQSGSVAIANGMTLRVLFDQLRDVRSEVQIPIILMGYLNQFMQFGIKDFLDEVKSSGVDGLIIPDLPIDIYEKEYQSIFEEVDVHVIFLITPQTSPERIRKIDQLSGGFIYMVSDASITGAKSEISPSQISYFKRIREMNLQSPLITGFGISNASTFQTASKYSQGAIIGSAFIKALKKNNLYLSVQDFIRIIRS